MTRDHDIQAFRAEELLLKRATEGLDDGEAAELAALGFEHDTSFDLAAASIDIATLRGVDELPAGVAAKILVAAGGRPSQPAIPTTLPGVLPARPISAPIPIVRPPERPSEAPADELAVVRAKQRPRAPLVAAYAAAAAGIALAIGAVLWARQQEPKVITREVDRVVLPTTLPPAEARAQLLATAPDVLTLPWTPTGDAAAQGASGDIVWSPSQQRGFMRFVGLAVNDPQVLQYQLWIFDGSRDDAFPVDGGVFDITPAGEVIVPISAKLQVRGPKLFAVTVEKPGGVVVSKRERIVVTAAPKAG